MKTVWGDALDGNNILSEYPRPQLVRDSYLSLNGIWNYAISRGEEKPKKFDGEILVPFSPESTLSKVNRTLMPGEYLWYEREVVLPKGFKKQRLIINFGAVDQCAVVYVSNKQLITHTGGYTPFSVEISALDVSDSFTLTLKVSDTTDTSFHSRGKQSLNAKGIWYTPQSGIWQSVWLESVGESYVKSLKITPHLDISSVEITAFCEGSGEGTLYFCEEAHSISANVPFMLKLKNFTPWSPKEPKLYDFSVSFSDDVVKSYFAMRKIEVAEDDEGIKRLFLNGKAYFHNGLLDQGYWPDGLYTAPSDAAMIYDIKTAKEMGFNMLRKHIKIEPLRWYYHCDRLGMIVWQDFVNGGGRYNAFTISSPLITHLHFSDRQYKLFARSDEKGREQYMKEMNETVETLYNCPSVLVWVPFNEGWGQFDAAAVCEKLKELDPTRVIDHASGWHDQFLGKLKSLHVYFTKYRFRKDKAGRAVVLSEFGGYGLKLSGHTYNDTYFCYKKFASCEKLTEAYAQLYEKQIIPAKEKGLAASVYTQLTDVESELNGLITYDRACIKPRSEKVKEINKKLME